MKNVLFFYTKVDSTKKRATIAGVINRDDNTMSFGISTCSKRDQFVKSKGRVIAQGRAIKRPVITVNITDESRIANQFIEQSKELIEDFKL
jgi:hypothetical protein